MMGKSSSSSANGNSGEDIKISDCRNPTELWKVLSKNQKVKQLPNLTGDTPKQNGYVRFVCISDTHNKTDGLQLPDGDILLHAGDFTNVGVPAEVEHFNNFLGKWKQKFEHIVVIAGNHDLSFELENLDVQEKLRMFAPTQLKSFKSKDFDPRTLLTNCSYIEDESITVKGYRIFGSPWQPEFGGWAFNLKRGEQLLERWNEIPVDTDILITHGPPLGYGDLCRSRLRAGCAELLSVIQKRVKPKFHIFGHIHEGYGTFTDGVTTFINASTCTLQYRPHNAPIVFDLPVRS